MAKSLSVKSRPTSHPIFTEANIMTTSQTTPVSYDDIVDVLVENGFVPVEGDPSEPTWLDRYHVEAWRPQTADGNEILTVRTDDGDTIVTWTTSNGIIFTSTRINTSCRRGLAMLDAVLSV
jgi:hypothetical protein